MAYGRATQTLATRGSSRAPPRLSVGPAGVPDDLALVTDHLLDQLYEMADADLLSPDPIFTGSGCISVGRSPLLLSRLSKPRQDLFCVEPDKSLLVHTRGMEDQMGKTEIHIWANLLDLLLRFA